MGYTITCNQCGEIFQIHVTEIKAERKEFSGEVVTYVFCPKCNKKLVLD